MARPKPRAVLMLIEKIDTSVNDVNKLKVKNVPITATTPTASGNRPATKLPNTITSNNDGQRRSGGRHGLVLHRGTLWCGDQQPEVGFAGASRCSEWDAPKGRAASTSSSGYREPL